LIVTLFQYEAFDINSAIKTSHSLQAYGSGLMAFIAIKIFAPIFLSRGDTKNARQSWSRCNGFKYYFESDIGAILWTCWSSSSNIYISTIKCPDTILFLN